MATYDMPTSRVGEAGSVGASAGANDPRDKSLGDLFADLTRDTAKLVRQEVELAKVEMSQKAAKVAKDVAMIAVGGLVAYAGMIVLFVGLGFLLVRAFGEGREWLAFLITGLLIAAVGGALAFMGLNALKKVDPLPRQTIETLKEDAQALKR